MCLHYLGHASFVLELDNGLRVLMDYGQSCAYGLDSPIHALGGLVPDVVTISHEHADHAGGVLPEGVGLVLRGAADARVRGLEIRSIPTFESSLETPDNQSFLFTYKGLRILHLGDCQALILAADQEEIRERIRATYPDVYDVVLVPIGFVRDILESAARFACLLRARRIVPMHYWSPADRDSFLALVDGRPGLDGRALRARAHAGARLCLDPAAVEGAEGSANAADLVVVGLVPAPYGAAPGMDETATAVPVGRAILPNGRFDADEWSDAAETPIGGGAALLLKHDARFVYLAVRFAETMHTGIDLFIFSGSLPPRKLHVSAALGDAVLTGSEWSEMTWGDNSDWTANTVGLIVVDGERQTVPLEGFEFQIARSAIPGDGFSLMLHLKRPDLVYPAEGNPVQPGTWWLARMP